MESILKISEIFYIFFFTSILSLRSLDSPHVKYRSHNWLMSIAFGNTVLDEHMRGFASSDSLQQGTSNSDFQGKTRKTGKHLCYSTV